MGSAQTGSALRFHHRRIRQTEHICGKDFATVSILLDADVKEQLDSFCDEHGTTPGQILTTALEWMVHHPEEAKSYLENLMEEDASCEKKN